MVSFAGIALDRLGKRRFLKCSKQKMVDVCLDAMEDGELDVCAVDGGAVRAIYLWEWCNMKPRQWVRLCALLQREGIPSSIVWQDLEADPPQFVEGVEYLWTDLDSVCMFMEDSRSECSCGLCDFCHARHWVGTELQRRRCLRRAWLVAVAR